jgi:hypothetical protein
MADRAQRDGRCRASDLHVRTPRILGGVGGRLSAQLQRAADARRTGEHAKVLALYRQLVGPHVQEADLFPGGVYNPNNRWNTTDGIVHLTQPANTLGAEINLAAQVTILRKDDNGNPIVAEAPLIRCSGFGDEDRASDPHIGQVVNGLAARGFSLTLLNPPGLYIHKLNTQDWTKPGPGNTRVATGEEFWRIVRGTPSRILRAIYEVPAGLAPGRRANDGKRHSDRRGGHPFRRPHCKENLHEADRHRLPRGAEPKGAFPLQKVWRL